MEVRRLPEAERVGFSWVDFSVNQKIFYVIAPRQSQPR